MKVAIYKADWFDVIAGTSSVKFKAGQPYPLTDETRLHISQGHADESDALDDLPKAEAAALKARKLADAAEAKAKAAEEAAAVAVEARRLADEADVEAKAEAAREAEEKQLQQEAEAAAQRIAAMNQEPNMYAAPAQKVAPPTREDLDKALAELPGSNTDPEYVVGAMRAFFGDLFTTDDEARVRDVVKAPPVTTASKS